MADSPTKLKDDSKTEKKEASENNKEAESEVSIEYVSSVDRTSVFKSVMKTSGSCLIIPYVKLEEVLELPFPQQQVTLANNTESNFLQDQKNARYVMEKILCLFVQLHYSGETGNALKSFWNFLTKGQTKKSVGLHHIDALLMEASSAYNKLLDHWFPHLHSQHGSATEETQASYSFFLPFLHSKSALERLEGFLLIEEDIKYPFVQQRVLAFMQETAVLYNEVSERIVNLMDAIGLEEESTKFVHSLTVSLSATEKLKISIPYPEKLQGVRWIRDIKTLFVMGRLKNMIAQRGNEIIQEKGCQQIVQYSEAASTSDKVTIVRSGGLKVLLDAMKTFPDNFYLQLGACGAVQHLTAKIDYNKLIAGKENGVLIIIEAMKRFPDNSEFQILACRTLTGLAFGVEYNKVLITTQALPFMLQKVITNKKSPDLVAVALGCVANLSTSDACKDIIVKGSGIATVCHTMQESLSQFPIQYYGLGALINLCTTEESKNVAVREGIVNLIVKLLKMFPNIYGTYIIAYVRLSVTEAAYRGLCALIAFSSSELAVEAMWKEDVMHHIKATQKNFADNEEIQGLVADALVSMNSTQ